MNVNPHLHSRLLGIQSSLNSQHQAGSGLPNASIGTERETLIREYLAKVFPASYRFATGAITDSSGNVSGQVDVVVEFPFEPSFPTPSSDVRLFLTCSVAAVIEVKSDLSSQWDEMAASVIKVKSLKRDIDVIVYVGAPIPETIPCFAVGYKGHQTVEGLAKRLETTPVDGRPDGVLVVDPGLYVGGGVTATGPLALYGLIVSLTNELARVKDVHPNLLAYVS